MKKLPRLCLPVFLAFAASFAWAEGPSASLAADNADTAVLDSRAIAESLSAIDEDLGSIDDIAAAILGETGSLKDENEDLQASMRELQRLNGEAGAEIGRLDERVSALSAKAELLGRKYDEALGLAQRYKASCARTRILAIGLGAATIALGGALVGVSMAR